MTGNLLSIFTIIFKMMDFSKLAKKAITFSLTRAGDNASTVSKYGGFPALDAPGEWPLKKDGTKMPFLGQLNFQQIRKACGSQLPALPEEGVLLLFVDPDNIYDLDDYFAFVYKKEIPLSGLSGDSAPGFESHVMVPALSDTYPHYFSAADLGIKEEELTMQVKEEYRNAGLLFDSHHQLLGFPYEIQDDPVIDVLDQLGELPGFKSAGDFKNYNAYKAWEKVNREAIRRERIKIVDEKSKDWTFLWQIPSDYDVYGGWGDNGNIYVLIETARLQKGDFSDLKLTWQGS